MGKDSSQSFIKRNRAPRVQIEYDVETYGAEKKIQLPFVMGVMADLSGMPKKELPAVANREFNELNVDNFSTYMKSVGPRVKCDVPNRLSDAGGKLSVDISFESMADFSPAQVAEKVDGLKQLLEARRQLANLKTYMDGKVAAEQLMAKVIQDPALLATLAQTKKPAATADAAASTGETQHG